jgi:hypothetical protein
MGKYHKFSRKFQSMSAVSAKCPLVTPQHSLINTFAFDNIVLSSIFR